MIEIDLLVLVRRQHAIKLGVSLMKTVSGALLLLAAEQSFAHAQLVQFPNHEIAGRFLIPAAVFFLALGGGLLTWGLLTESLRQRSE